MVAEAVRTYLLHDLEAAPHLLARVVAPSRGMPGSIDVFRSDFDWDARPDPERFTLREMVAHLADWEEIWLQRVRRIEAEDNPFLHSVDEGAVAAEREYGIQPYGENLIRFAEGRERLVAALRSLPAGAWSRPAHREFVGDINLLQLVAMIAGHDGYHLRQALDYTAS